MSGHLRPIAFMGKAGTGKTTLAQMLSEHYGYDRLSIAEPIREVAQMAFGKFDKQTKYPQNTLGLARLISGRELLQEIGAALREMDSLFWLRVWRRRVECEQVDGTVGLGANRPWAVDDLRLDAERNYIAAWYPHTLFVRLVRPPEGATEPWQLDITERQAGELPAELVLDTQALTPLECIAAVLEAAKKEVVHE